MTTRINKSTDDGEPLVAEQTEAAAEQLAALKDEALKIVEQRVAALTKTIQQYPLLAVGVGFGVGYLLARLLHARRG